MTDKPQARPDSDPESAPHSGIAATTLRQRRRHQLVESVLETARRHLVSQGAAALSLRAVAREIGIAPSALHRYFPTREDLLTELVVRTYTDIVDVIDVATSQALTRHPRDPIAAWVEATLDYRRWAKDHFAEWALVYGTPVPGYQGPEDRTGQVGRQAGAGLAVVLVTAGREGLLNETYLLMVHEQLPASMRDDLDAVSRDRGLDVLPGAAAGTLVVAMGAWAKLQGLLGMELFQHLPMVDPWTEEMFTVEVAAILKPLIVNGPSTGS